jgi:hypothetical protein
MSSYGSGLSSGVSQGAGKLNFINKSARATADFVNKSARATAGFVNKSAQHKLEMKKGSKLNVFYFLFCFLGVISHGLSMPLQVPGQPPDLTSNYWPRLQWRERTEKQNKNGEENITNY